MVGLGFMSVAALRKISLTSFWQVKIGRCDFFACDKYICWSFQILGFLSEIFQFSFQREES